PTLASTVGNTPLVRLQRLRGNTSNVILAKLEGNNPAGSVKDRPALSMIVEAEKRGSIKPGDTLIEATSGNTGIALAMVAAIKGAQPAEGAQIPGIRKWPEAYLPKIYDKARVDRLEYVSQADAETMTRRLAAEEGIFAGISSGGACEVALRIANEVDNATIV